MVRLVLGYVTHLKPVIALDRWISLVVTRLRHEGREVWGLRRPRSQTLGDSAAALIGGQ